MGESCVWIPSVDSNGTASKLFTGLLAYYSKDLSREDLVDLYESLKSDKFKSTHKKNLVLDEYGEPTIESILALEEFNLRDTSYEKTINFYNSRLEDLGWSKERSFEEIEEILNSSTLSIPKDMMFQIDYIGGMSFKLKIVKRTSEEEVKLENTIKDYNKLKELISIINSAGGKCNINDVIAHTKFSIASVLDDIQFYIDVKSKNKTLEDITEETAQMIGILALNTLGKDHVLVRRLLESVENEDLQREILGKSFLRASSSGNIELRTAAKMLTNVILGNKAKYSFINRLTDRIILIWNKIFHKQEDIRRIKTEAEIKAKKLYAKVSKLNEDTDFSMRNREKVIENINALEALRNKSFGEKSTIKDTFVTILGRLRQLTTEMSSIDRSLRKKYKQIELNASKDKMLQLDYGPIVDSYSFTGVIEAVDSLLNVVPEIQDSLDAINFNVTEEEYQKNLPLYAKALRQANAYMVHAKIIYNHIDDLLSDNSVNLPDPNKLKELRRALKSQLEIIERDVQHKAFNVFAVFLSGIYGDDSIKSFRHLTFSGVESSKYYSITDKKGSLNVLSKLPTDDSLIDRYLASMSDSSDVVNQIVYKAVSAANDWANIQTITLHDKLRVLEDEMKKDKIDQSKFFEISNNTKQLTGYYVSPEGYNLGDWETNKEEHRKACLKEFERKYGNSFSTDIEREYAWDTFYAPKLKQWKKENCNYNKETKTLVPNEKYKSSQYENLTSEERKYLSQIIEIKKEIDENYLNTISVKGSIVSVPNAVPMRAPQFIGSTQNRIENYRREMSLIKACTNVIRNNIVRAFIETSEDTDFGSTNTINNSPEDMIHEKYSKSYEARVRRIAIYGINKRSNMGDLTTDVINGLLQYGVMAFNYKSMNTIVDTLEVGNSVLSSRYVGETSTPEKETRAGRTYSHARYIDFLESQVYNIHSKKKVLSNGIVVNKVVNIFNNFGRVVGLGLNAIGGTVNVFNGFIQIIQEGFAGDTIDFKTAKKALQIYFANSVENLTIELGKAQKENKVSLFMREFNVQNNIKQDMIKYRSREGRVSRLLSFDNVYFPYTMGDHFMQSISYLAYAQKVKVVTEEGNIISLYDAYKVIPIDPEKPNGPKTLKLLEGIKIKDEDSGELREWNNGDRINFVNKCRQANNKMHGVYNHLDKTAFHNSLTGTLILSMRGYALGMWQKRYGRYKSDVITGTESEGYYVTLGKLLYNIFGGRDTLLNNVKHSLHALICPYGQRATITLKQAGLGQYQIENIRRFHGHLLIRFLLALARSAAAPPEKEDPNYYPGWEEDHRMRGMLYYFLNRLYIESLSFDLLSLPLLYRELRNLSDVTPAGISIAYQVAEAAYWLVSGKENAEGENKGAEKLWKLLPYEKHRKVIESGYDAAKSYDWYREKSTR